MSDQSAVDAVLAFLESPDLATEAAGSPAVRATLNGLLDQVLDEIAMLSPVLAQHEVAERDRIQRSLELRQQIVARIRAILARGDEAIAPPTKAGMPPPPEKRQERSRT
jgi:predicted dinucleotide-utilizing enzyme